MKKRLLIILIISVILVVSFFIIFKLKLTGQVTHGEETKFSKTYIHAGTLLASKSSLEDNLEYYIQDHLGSNRKVINGQVEEQSNNYYAFGETKETTGNSGNDYKYTGKELDSETGLYYYGARYYLPEIGRFIQADALKGSISNPLSLNRYAYVQNNPLKFIDPTGNRLRGVHSSVSETAVNYLNELVGEGTFKVGEDKEVIVAKKYSGKDKNKKKIFKLFKKLISKSTTINLEISEKARFSISKSKEIEGGKIESIEFTTKAHLESLGEEGKMIELTPQGSLVHESQHALDVSEEKNPTESAAVGMENVAREIQGLDKRVYYSVHVSSFGYTMEGEDEVRHVSFMHLYTPKQYDKKDFSNPYSINLGK